MRDEDTDPVLTLLAGLRAPRPTMVFDDRVRRRCHEAMRRKIRPRVSKPLLQRVADLALVAVAGGYAAIALVEAAQVAARVLAAATQ